MYSVSIRSRSSGNRSARKLSGTSYRNRAGASFSYGPRIQPPRSSRTYQCASASRSTGCCGLDLAPFDQRRIGLGDDILMLDRDRRDVDPQQPRGALGMVAGGGDHMFGRDFKGFLGRHQMPPFSAMIRPLTIHSLPVQR